MYLISQLNAQNLCIEELTDISQFILRCYFFFQDELDPMDRLAQVLSANSVASCAHNPKFMDQPELFYELNCSHARMRILAVKTARESDYWSGGLNQLSRWEEQAQISSEDLMGQLTVLVGSPCEWAELKEEACSLLACPDALNMRMEHGMLARLSVDWNHGETFYLCGLNEPESESVQFLSRRLPLLHGSIIRLHLLDGLLRDRHLAIRQEKEELERQLIHILHSKLVMAQASLTATEELESEIEGLAMAFGKLVGDQNLITDGIKRLEFLISGLEKQLAHESALELPAVLFKQLSESYEQRLADFRNTHEELKMVQDNYQAAIEVVQSKIDIMNSRTNIATQEQIKGLLEVNTAMQKQSLVFQYAAGLIEFIVLAYYSHTLWSHLDHAAYLAIPGWIQFIVVMLFSGNTVLVTHLLAEYMQGDSHVRNKLIIAAIPLVLIIGLVVIASVFVGAHGAAH